MKRFEPSWLLHQGKRKSRKVASFAEKPASNFFVSCRSFLFPSSVHFDPLHFSARLYPPPSPIESGFTKLSKDPLVFPLLPFSFSPLSPFRYLSRSFVPLQHQSSPHSPSPSLSSIMPSLSHFAPSFSSFVLSLSLLTFFVCLVPFFCGVRL